MLTVFCFRALIFRQVDRSGDLIVGIGLSPRVEQQVGTAGALRDLGPRIMLAHPSISNRETELLCLVPVVVPVIEVQLAVPSPLQSQNNYVDEA